MFWSYFFLQPIHADISWPTCGVQITGPKRILSIRYHRNVNGLFFSILFDGLNWWLALLILFGAGACLEQVLVWSKAEIINAIPFFFC